MKHPMTKYRMVKTIMWFEANQTVIGANQTVIEANQTVNIMLFNHCIQMKDFILPRSAYCTSLGHSDEQTCRKGLAVERAKCPQRMKAVPCNESNSNPKVQRTILRYNPIAGHASKNANSL